MALKQAGSSLLQRLAAVEGGLAASAVGRQAAGAAAGNTLGLLG
jgi:hypothetical protein